jgi:hypothetical protein
MSAPFEDFDGYLNGQMPDDEAATFEEEMFAAAAVGGEASEDAQFVDRLARYSAYLIPRGGFDIGSTRADVERLLASGLRVQLMESDPIDPRRLAAIRDDAEIIITHIPIDVRGYDSVDVVVTKPDGTLLKTFRDIGWEPSDGSLYAVCEAPLARISAQQRHIFSQVVGHRDGAKHTIARFETLMPE